MKKNISNRQNGFTLIEIMISLILGAFLIGGVMEIFIQTKQSNLVNEELAKLQENGRFAIEFLSRDIRLADYRYCQTATPPSLAVFGSINGNVAEVYEGVKSAISSALDAPDSINVRWSDRGNGTGCLIFSDATNPESPKNRFFEINSGALVQGSPLVEGVENMQILYGEDTDLNVATGFSTDYAANYYVPYGTAGLNMARVVSVRISLLLATDDNVATKPVPFTYNGGTFTPNDRKLRRVYTTTIALRNRIKD